MTIEELFEFESSSIEPETSKETRESQSNRSKLRLPKDTDIEKLVEDNRFYLPVLHINDPTMWDSKPLSERLHFTDEVAMETCLSNCCGTPGVRNACCVLDKDDLEHVLGPVDEDWIKKMILWYKKKGMTMNRSDIVIDFEEGKLIGDAHFGGHRVFTDPKTYPILRIQAYGPRFACKFLNVHNGKCTIYAQRSDMCKDYACQYVQTNFLVKDKNHPSKWIAADKIKKKLVDDET